jgi:biofilm protein TabA
MIYGHLTTFTKQELDSLHPVLGKALLRLAETDLKALAAGKYEWDGDRLFLLIQEMETAPKSDKKLESHLRYVDIQYLIDGEEETIGYVRRSERHIVSEDLLETKDIAFYEDTEEEMALILKPGMFTIFFPSDLHRPGVRRLEPASIKKAVVKVSLALLD